MHYCKNRKIAFMSNIKGCKVYIKGVKPNKKGKMYGIATFKYNSTTFRTNNLRDTEESFCCYGLFFITTNRMST